MADPVEVCHELKDFQYRFALSMCEMIHMDLITYGLT